MLNTPSITSVNHAIKRFVEFFLYVAKRFAQNRCSSIAAELTVTSLLALVPLTTVVFALLAFMPSFRELGDQLQNLLFQYFVPGTGETVKNYINEFVGKAKGLSGVGSLALLITALLMMRTIDSSFNKIWQVKSKQSLVRTLLVYWAVLTLGPILLGSSLLLTSYLKTLPFISDVVSSKTLDVASWLPFLMALAAFSVMYYVIPNRRIPIKHALLAGIVAALFFEFAKSAFAIFVTSFSTYQVIFGALAAIPLFLIWIYLSWLIVLLGAEFCHALDAFESVQNKNAHHPFINSLSLLTLLANYQKAGGLLYEEELLSWSRPGMKSTNLAAMKKLVAAGLVAQGQDQSYCLICASEQINYFTIFKVAGCRLPSEVEISKAEIPAHLKNELLELVQKTERLLSDHPVTSDCRD